VTLVEREVGDAARQPDAYRNVWRAAQREVVEASERDDSFAARASEPHVDVRGAPMDPEGGERDGGEISVDVSRAAPDLHMPGQIRVQDDEGGLSAAEQPRTDRVADDDLTLTGADRGHRRREVGVEQADQRCLGAQAEACRAVDEREPAARGAVKWEDDVFASRMGSTVMRLSFQMVRSWAAGT